MVVNSLQTPEILSTENNNYLLIHKNGCSQIRGSLLTNYKQIQILDHLPNQNPYWTTLRDPYDRLISGLTYDILKIYNNIDNIDKVINYKNVKDIIYNRVSINRKSTGIMNHTTLQWIYLFNQPLNFFVSIENLDLFLNIHFQTNIKSPHFINENNQNNKDKVNKYIQSNPLLSQTINHLLAPDYMLINHFKSEDLMWNWSWGKMF